MSQHGWANCPEAVRAQVERLLTGLRSALDDNLLGVYLHGSLAMGCFNPQCSDIDLLVVTRRGMALETKRRVAGLLLRCSNDPRPVEISFLSGQNLHPWRHPTPYDFHYGEDWREKLQHQLTSGEWQKWNREVRTDADLAAHVTLTLNRGVCLYGKPMAEVFPAVPPEHYVYSIVSDFYWAEERIARYPVYFVLNACRVLAYLREGRICSKEEGGVWAIQALPDAFKTLVARALDMYRGDRLEGQFDTAGLQTFAAYMDECVANAQG